jgi:hypothetical protein
MPTTTAVMAKNVPDAIEAVMRGKRLNIPLCCTLAPRIRVNGQRQHT